MRSFISALGCKDYTFSDKILNQASWRLKLMRDFIINH